MALVGTPNAGLDAIAALAYLSSGLTMVAYSNAGNSLGPLTVVANLTQPTSTNGYAPLLLNGAWSSVNGVITYVHSAGASNFNGNPGWQASGGWSVTVNGIALIEGAVVRHFFDLNTPFIAVNLKKLVADLSTVASG